MPTWFAAVLGEFEDLNGLNSNSHSCIETQDTLHGNLCNCSPCLGRNFGFASNCPFSSHICFISWKWLYLNYWLVCQHVISVDLSTKIKVGYGIPLGLSTKVRSRSMIPVDLSTKWQSWIYDLRGSRSKIHGIGSQNHFLRSTPMPGMDAYIHACMYISGFSQSVQSLHVERSIMMVIS